MRKTFVWALMATLLVAGSAFAGPWNVSENATFATGGPATTNNDDSCDISVTPAATLLLPYFEVDIESAAGTGETTLFTITNVSQLPQVAHVTLWTDWSYPVIDFNIYLTGYDVQSINLYDVIVRGELAPDAGTGSGISPVGALSGTSATAEYNNPLLDEADCFSAAPVDLNEGYVIRMQQAFTLGRFPILGALNACTNIGGTHDNAVGYATIDVANRCSTALPTDAGYFTTEINFDNVFIGDYQQVNGDEDFAQGNPMVHIRAIPEGGTAADPVVINFDRTFYGRYTGGSNVDRRQPLPALFAARWISGGATGFETFFKIWREGRTGATSACSPASANLFPRNGALGVAELVRFDEEENPTTLTPAEEVSPPIETDVSMAETGLYDVTDTGTFPPNPDDAVSGWMYLNLNEPAAPEYPAGIATQNWVIVSMRAEDRFSVDFDAAFLGNGCTPEEATSDETTNPIGPAANFNPIIP
jgi:hypothetical protein